MRLMLFTAILFVTTPLVAAEPEAPKDEKPAETKLIRLGSEDEPIMGAEIERNEKTSKIRIIHKKGTKLSSVGSGLFITLLICKVAQSRDCEYFVNLGNRIDEEGNSILTVGFTNNKDADIKTEFGPQYIKKNDPDPSRQLFSVSEFMSLIEKE